MKTLTAICLLFFASCFAMAQTSTPIAPVQKGATCPQVQQFDLTFTASAQSLTIANDCGATNLNLAYEITGTPAPMAIVAKGCMRSSTSPQCDTLDTNANTTNSTSSPTFTKVYDFFTVTPTWTGGGVTVKVHSTTSPFAKNGGSGTCGTCALDSNTVHKTGIENIAGQKNFTDALTNVQTISGSVAEFGQFETTADLPGVEIFRDQDATPTSNPDPQHTYRYTLNGQVCTKDPAGIERCLGPQAFSVNINGTSVVNPNFNDALPVADAGYTLGKWISDGVHAIAIELPTPPASGDGQSSTISDSAAINTTETVIGQTPSYPANSLLAGTVFHFTAMGKTTDTVANASTFKVRIGSTCSVSDTTVVTLTTGASGTTGTNVAFDLELDFDVRTVGSGTSGTVMSYSKLFSGANGIQGATTVQNAYPTNAGFDTTIAGQCVSLTYSSAATTTTSTFSIVNSTRSFK